MHDRRFAFVDIETTGLDPDIHEIISIGCIIGEWQSETTIKVVEKFEIKIKPEFIERAHERSLRVNKYTKESWGDAISLKKAMEQFAKKTEGAIMVSHNVSFDAGFLEKAFKTTDIPPSMHYHKLDTISLAYAVLKDTDVKRYSLQYLCDYFEIKNVNPHTALADTEALFALFLKLMHSSVVE